MSNRYVVTRSPASPRLFNVTLVNKEGDILATWATDLEFEEASECVELLVPPQAETMTAERNMMKYSKWDNTEEGAGYA